MKIQGKAVIDAMQHKRFYAPHNPCQDKFVAMHKRNIYHPNDKIRA